ncbi:hypothetical protein BDU57DRAFT_516705 [Ampelomyces quisqualis]|uniref:Uncharacterized protein n=1 Tax=Ampelomyces quisqualis TaxID=50730 RepID=A0A6A5QM76_AMPQU|nr:hypothetical protein BDU57DRAFT_516705 [Ampelomyces quisqualis]
MKYSSIPFQKTHQTNNMFGQNMSTSIFNNEKNIPAMVDNKTTRLNGPLKRGLDGLTQVLERRIDRQILQAQIRAYDHSPVLPNKSRFM